MTISLTSVAAATTPTVIKTFFQHYKTQLSKDKEDRWTEGEPQRSAAQATGRAGPGRHDKGGGDRRSTLLMLIPSHPIPSHPSHDSSAPVCSDR